MPVGVAAAAAFVLVGVCMLVWPRRFWYVTHGRWWYDNPEDVRLSDAYLVWNGVGAVSVIFAGLAMLLAALQGASG